MNRRMVLNTLMLGMFIFLFGFKFFPPMWHPVVGVLVLIPVMIHILYNRRWFTALTRGRWNRKRRLWTILNLALLITVFLTVLAGILCSPYATFLPTGSLPFNPHTLSRAHKFLAKILFWLIICHVFFHRKAFSSWIRHGLKR